LAHRFGDTHITLNGNHPLTGFDLAFDIEIVLIRQASVEESQHGHGLLCMVMRIIISIQRVFEF